MDYRSPMGFRYEEIAVGDTGSLSKTVTEADVVLYAGITGDNNPVHVNELAAAESRFGRRVAHGMLTAGFISAVLGTCLPGRGAVYLSQTLKFLRPVYIGDTVTATAEVLEKNDKRKQVRLRTVVVNQDGKKVIDGEAEALLTE